MKNVFKIFNYKEQDVLAQLIYSEDKHYGVEFITRVGDVGNTINLIMEFATYDEACKSFDNLTRQTVANLLAIALGNMIPLETLPKIMIVADELFEFKSKEDWIVNAQIKYAQHRINKHETLLCFDNQGHLMAAGADFQAAEDAATYPCRVYRLRQCSNEFFFNDLTHVRSL